MCDKTIVLSKGCELALVVDFPRYEVCSGNESRCVCVVLSRGARTVIGLRGGTSDRLDD